ncbi:hypothetical protein H671_2g6704 [Cricetulus griseus]|nr:hypothetical protein H671_2g6704 [Cricetulus griseus]
MQLDSSSIQCLAVGVYFYFHQLLDEGSRTTYKGYYDISILALFYSSPDSTFLLTHVFLSFPLLPFSFN